MVEETNQTATPEVAKTDTAFVPEWKVKADKLKKGIEEGLGVQIVFDAPQNGGCEPRLSSTKVTRDNYPTVIEEPTGLICPQFNWFSSDSTKRGWFEAAPAAQGRKIEELSDDLKKVVQNQMQIKQDQANADKEKQADDKKNDQAIKLMTMISTQMGILNAKVDKISKSATTNPEPDAKASTETDKPVQPVEGGNE